MQSSKKLYIKQVFLLVFVFISTESTAQIELNCCGIKQTVPVFKDDTNFSLGKYYSALTTKKIIPPINESDAPAEIRFIILGTDMDLDMGIIKCYNNHIAVNRYQLAVRTLGSSVTIDEKKYYNGYQDIGPEKSGYLLTNLIKTTDLAAKFKAYNWDKFFNQLIVEHLFDLPSGNDFMNLLISTGYNSTVDDGSTVIIQIKAGNNYRNLRYDDFLMLDKISAIDMVKHQRNVIKLLEDIFYSNK